MKDLKTPLYIKIFLYMAGKNMKFKNMKFKNNSKK